MTNSLAARCLGLSLSLCSAGEAAAAPPQGDYVMEVAGAEVEVWVPDGADEYCEYDGSDSVCLSSDVHTSALGIVSGTGMVGFHFFELFDLDMPLQVSGKMSGSTKKPKVSIEVSGMGTAAIYDAEFYTWIDVDATGKSKLTCTNPLPHLDAFHCKGSFKLCLYAFGRRSCASDRIEMFLEANGGPWLLSLTLATDDEKKITGTATTQLANGEVEAFTVTGKYDPRKDRSSLKLKKVDPASKDRVSFSNFVESLDSGTIDFKLANETGKLKLIPPPP